MKPRAKPLVVPSPMPDRYWAVDLVGTVYTFKNPHYGVGSKVVACMGRHAVDPATDTRSVDEQAVALLPLVGLVVGICWAHPDLELETPAPKLSDLSDEALLPYGQAVCDELQDADIDMLQMMDLFGAVTPQLHKRQSLLLMATERSTFSVAPQEGSTA